MCSSALRPVELSGALYLFACLLSQVVSREVISALEICNQALVLLFTAGWKLVFAWPWDRMNDMCQEYIEAQRRSFVTNNFTVMMACFLRQSLCLRSSMHRHWLFWLLIFGKAFWVLLCCDSKPAPAKKRNRNVYSIVMKKSVTYLAGQVTVAPFCLH